MVARLAYNSVGPSASGSGSGSGAGVDRVAVGLYEEALDGGRGFEAKAG